MAHRWHRYSCLRGKDRHMWESEIMATRSHGFVLSAGERTGWMSAAADAATTSDESSNCC